MSPHDAAVVALAEAIKFESDGRDFYLRAADEARNPSAQAVFRALADDERDHVRRVREIYEELKAKPGWPDVGAMVARASGVLDAFEKALGTDLAAAGLDEALATAVRMEKEGVAFYRERLSKATCEAERDFFRRLIAEEEIHLRAVQDLRASFA